MLDRAEPAGLAKESSSTNLDTPARLHSLNAWKQAAVLVVVTRLVFYAIAYASTWLFSAAEGPNAESFLEIWSRWDVKHFVVVAEHGWVDPVNALPARPAAFFPLYPLAMRALMALSLPPIAAGLIISALATFVACAFLIKLADEELGDGAGPRAAVYMLLFPTAVFLVAPYSEALFLAGAIPAFYFARKQRWLAAAIPAAVAMSSRAAGMFLLAGLFFEFVRQAAKDRSWGGKRLRDASIALLVGLLPLLGYAFYLWRARGTPFQFFIDQREGWGRDFPTHPLTAFLATWNTRIGAGYPANWIFAWRIEILAALAGVALTVWAGIKREWGYAAFMGVFIVSLMMSAWYFSIPRMLLSFFPAYIFLATYTQSRPDRHELILLVTAPLAAMGVIVFTRAAWFF